MPRLFVGVVVVVAATALVIRLPASIRGLDDQATRNAAGGPQGRLLVTADSLDIDNDFVLAALATLPQKATYTVQSPQSAEVAASSYGIGELTLEALPAYMRFLLLPRREVQPDAAQYVLCYACDTSRWDHHTTWLWQNQH